MANRKYDGVIDAVHYTPGGQIAWVRAYERRGAAFSDQVLLDREALVELLKTGKRFMAGRRLPQMGSDFETWLPIRLLRNHNLQEVIVVGYLSRDTDYLEGIPVI